MSGGARQAATRDGARGEERRGARSSTGRPSAARGAASTRGAGRGGRAAQASGGRQRRAAQPGGRAPRRTTAGARTGQAAQGAPRPRQAVPGTARSHRATSTQAGRPSRSTRAGGAHPHSRRLRALGARGRGRLRPRYGLRRTVVAGLAILLVVGLGAGAVASALWVRQTIRTQDADRAAAQARTVYPQPQSCAVGDLEVASSGPQILSAGEGGSFTVSLTNAGSEPCLLDVGQASLGVLLTSGEEQVWSSAACPAGSQERLLLLGQGDATEVGLEWNGYAAGSDCDLAHAPAAGAAASAEPSASPDPSASQAPQEGESAPPSADPAPAADERIAGPGSYHYRFTLGGQDLTEDALLLIQ
ncbi:hypothetical protein J5X07_01540 [Actinomyces bowdenii]|uniref:DUF4232 domain-containing protein n=1 Tax=Actinomyces bowdenii TaxID=131109 RepID=A0A3P1VAW2_9ACTO|nr:hypothetical protein [Actinomyces bowdenii]MBO3723726.1 hypothetical protein [Actinomyces bowdenii]RRD30807.1 hypothetical protein EII10_01500 [Actinomyces bowdenii]